MAIAVQKFFKERKSPFILTISVLFSCTIFIILLTSSTNTIQNPLFLYTDGTRIHSTVQWELCDGPTAVDYIPCLDNFIVIKALKERRHMERRERHCPRTSPRCLVPLPKGYKIPVPWPKSRDMVRL